MTDAAGSPGRMSPAVTALTLAVAGASIAASGLTVHTARNLRLLRVPPRPGPGDPSAETPVAVLLPVRDEAHRIAPCLTALRAQDHPDMRVIVLDDGSTDGTGDLTRRIIGDDDRFLVRLGGQTPPPEGWLGKPWACHRLADEALAGDRSPRLLVFLDADVTLAPDALRRVAALMASSRLDLASPYPRQEAISPAERLVQPLLQWSWATTLPLDLAEVSARPSLTAANGQLLAIRTTIYRSAGGHAAVRGEVLEDLALAQRVKSVGGRASVVDGTDVATCRMYDGGRELVDGYTKSLWSAFGSAPRAAGALAILTFTYALPPIAAVLGPTATIRLVGAGGYAAGVVGRVMVARRTAGRAGDSWSHPVAILALDALTVLSFRRHRRGTLRWKGRPVSARPPPTARPTEVPTPSGRAVLEGAVGRRATAR